VEHGRRRSWIVRGGRLSLAFLASGLLSLGVSDTAHALGNPVLLTITVSPAVASIASGQTQQFTATGTYSDLSTQNLTDSVTWSSSSKSTATISSTGLATGVASGAVTITATDPSTLNSGTAALTVTPAVLVAITVSPAVASIAAGDTQQFTATGTYSDLSSQNLTDSVTWSSSSSATATVSSTGLATGVATGAVTITAKDPSSLISGTAALTVTPAVLVAIVVTPPVASIAAGDTEQFTATGTYSDLSTQNLTDSVTWSSSSKSTAKISSSGLATGVATGAVTITAKDPASLISGTAALTVTPAVLVAIVVTPALASATVGHTQQFTATGTYSDLSTQDLTDTVKWTTSSKSIATISSTGLAKAVAGGTVTMTAKDSSAVISGTAVLNVTSSQASLKMTPTSGGKKTRVTFDGTGFTPNQTVRVAYLSGLKKKKASTVLCTASISSTGTFTCNGRIPKRRRDGPLGGKTVEATDSDGSQATTTFDLT
jgi:trimeric autotransporter adhesin